MFPIAEILVLLKAGKATALALYLMLLAVWPATTQSNLRASIENHHPAPYHVILAASRRHVTDGFLRRVQEYEHAAKARPDLLSCLQRSHFGVVSITELDWSGFRSRQEIEVCVYYVATFLEEPARLAAWLQDIGMTRVEVRRTARLSNRFSDDPMWVFGYQPNDFQYFSTNPRFIAEALFSKNVSIHVDFASGHVANVDFYIAYK